MALFILSNGRCPGIKQLMFKKPIPAPPLHTHTPLKEGVQLAGLAPGGPFPLEVLDNQQISQKVARGGC